jgi:hypothetical protein
MQTEMLSWIQEGNPIVLRNASKSIIYTLPNKPIKVVFRSDGSGTTNNFVGFMRGVAPTVWTKPANDAFTTSFPGNINDHKEHWPYRWRGSITGRCITCCKDTLLNHICREAMGIFNLVSALHTLVMHQVTLHFQNQLLYQRSWVRLSKLLMAL